MQVRSELNIGSGRNIAVAEYSIDGQRVEKGTDLFDFLIGTRVEKGTGLFDFLIVSE